MSDDKVTIQRETRALDALELESTVETLLTTASAIDALRAALAAQTVDGFGGNLDDAFGDTGIPVTALDNACMTEQVIDEYLCGYTMDGDSEFHLPTESELLVIKDAIMGLLVYPDFIAAFAVPPGYVLVPIEPTYAISAAIRKAVLGAEITTPKSGARLSQQQETSHDF